MLDGITGAVLRVVTAQVIAGVTKGTGCFNLAQGLLGTTMGEEVRLTRERPSAIRPVSRRPGCAAEAAKARARWPFVELRGATAV